MPYDTAIASASCLKKKLSIGIISLFSSIALINFQVNRKSCIQNTFHSSASRAFVTRKRFSACWESLRSVPLRSAQSRRPPDVLRRSECFNGSSRQRKNRSESSPRLQKIFTCACGLHVFCSPRLYAFSSLRSAEHCTGQS